MPLISFGDVNVNTGVPQVASLRLMVAKFITVYFTVFTPERFSVLPVIDVAV